MSYERAIECAFDKLSGEFRNADDIFQNAKDGFVVRKQFHTNEVELYCLECEQKLNVSTSKYDRLHFKHIPNSEDCLLKNGQLSIEDSERIYNILKLKESPRHYELKNKIAQRISNIDGIDKSSIATDNKFIIKENGKRKPDVYCKYKKNGIEYEIVFEIQLSQLSLRYILNRYNFYKENKIYLIWILDNFNLHDQSQLVRDIKYLTEFQNFFKLDETTDNFNLLCDYKYSFLTDDNKLLSKWLKKSIPLQELKFSEKYFQVYYYNFSEKLADLEIEQKKNEIEKEKLQKQQEEIELKRKQEYRVNNVISEIKKVRKLNYFKSDDLTLQVLDLNNEEIKLLNQKLKISDYINLSTNKPFLNHLLTVNEKAHFILFFLKTYSIELDINKTDNKGITIFQEIFINEQKYFDNKDFQFSKYVFLKEIFKRNYSLRNSDIELIKSVHTDKKRREEELIRFNSYNRLSNRFLIDLVDKYLNLICIIETAKCGSIVASNLTDWKAYANNAITHYPKQWKYIELAFRKYGLFDQIMNIDLKGTFHKKLSLFYGNMPEQDYICDSLIYDLYFELFT